MIKHSQGICGDCKCQTDEGVIVQGDRNVCGKCAESYTRCEHCDDFENDDNIFSFGGRMWCDECFRDNVFSCDGCNRDYHNDDSWSHNDGRYCEDCFNDIAISCNDCGENVSREDAVYLEDCGDYCQSCFDERGFLCEECTAGIENANGKEWGGKRYCEGCHSLKSKSVWHPRLASNPKP